MRLFVPLLAIVGLTAADVTVKPLQVVVNIPTAMDLSFHDKPMGYEPGYKIHLLLQGEGISAIKKDSLTIEAITGTDGKNLAVGRAGKPTWKMGSFPKVTEDGKAAIISIEGTDALLGKVDGLTLTGAVTLMLGNEVAKTGPVEMEAKGSEAKQFPGFTVKTGGTDVSAKWQDKGDPEVQVTIEGNLDAIIEVKATQGGKALKSSGSFFDDSWKTLQFGGSIEGKVTIEVTYWKDLKALKVPFTVALKP